MARCFWFECGLLLWLNLSQVARFYIGSMVQTLRFLDVHPIVDTLAAGFVSGIPSLQGIRF
jgi:hypothetical protein